MVFSTTGSDARQAYAEKLRDLLRNQPAVTKLMVDQMKQVTALHAMEEVYAMARLRKEEQLTQFGQAYKRWASRLFGNDGTYELPAFVTVNHLLHHNLQLNKPIDFSDNEKKKGDLAELWRVSTRAKQMYCNQHLPTIQAFFRKNQSVPSGTTYLDGGELA